MSKSIIEKRVSESFVNIVKVMYKVYDNNTDILDCTEASNSEYELEFFESYGGGISGVGSFKISKEKICKYVQQFKSSENFINIINNMYKTYEGIEILNCTEISDTECELEFIESCGGGFSAVGSFRILKERLYENLQQFSSLEQLVS